VIKANGVVTAVPHSPSLSPSTLDPSCGGVAIDSGTPLLSPGNSDISSDTLVHCESRLILSSDVSTTSSDATVITEMENTGSTFVDSPVNVSTGMWFLVFINIACVVSFDM